MGLKAARQTWQLNSAAAVGDPRRIRISLAERELGVFVRYSRVNQLGCLRERMTNALKRLRRLKSLPATVEQRALLVQTNVWPAAFYGAELTYMGASHFRKLRGVLCAKTTMTSTMLAMPTLTDRVCDPFLYVLLKALSLWRRLFAAHQDIGLFLHVLGSASCDPVRAFGPATTLKAYLQRVHWSVNEHGQLIDHLGTDVNLADVSSSDLLARLWDAWAVVVTDSVATRRDFHGWPQINLLMTRRLPPLDDLPDAAVIGIERSLGKVFALRRETWAQSDAYGDGSYPLCGGCDDRVHFPMQCPILEPLRLEHADILRVTCECHPHSIFLPVI